MRHGLLVDLRAGERLGVESRNHPGEILQRSHVLHGVELVEIVGQREAVLFELFGKLLRFLLIDGGLGLFDEREHVAHAENAARHAVGVEHLDGVELFADAGELDGLARHGLDGERRAAAGVAVELGEHHAGDAESLVKGGGGVHGVLTGHRVHNEQDLRRLGFGLDAAQLIHERLVNVEAAGRIEEYEIVSVTARVIDRVLRDLRRVALTFLIYGKIELFADGFELIDRSGTVHVARDEQGTLVLALAHERGELCAVRGFAGALQADEHHDARGLRADAELLALAAHERAQLLVDDLDDHLRGGETLEHVRADGALADGFDKVLDDLVAHVGLEQRETHLAHRFLYVRLRQTALAAELFENVIEFVGKIFKCHVPAPVTRRRFRAPNAARRHRSWFRAARAFPAPRREYPARRRSARPARSFLQTGASFPRRGG